MRRLCCVLLAAASLLSCNHHKTGATGENASDSPATTNTTPAADLLQTMLGSFVGDFGGNKITLLITKISGDSVSGRSIVAGNNRPFAGTFTRRDDTFVFNASEPGDDKYDGVFHFEIKQSAPDVVNGSWKPNDTNRPEKSYSLQRRSFEYHADAGTYPEASTRLLKPADVEDLMKEDLEYMRNEIFARHGYCFNKKDMRQQFETLDWYVPNTVDIKGYLTDIEKKNIALIKRYEKYAQDYGDEYGR